jgi:NAD(P)-dependent dehydrogenase (short-subunit alcohol dehydrogenase family)
VDLGLRGRRAIVTGASRGLGLEISRHLSAEGAVVAMVARHLDELEAAAEGVGRAFTADTQDDESVRSMVGNVASELGGVDILVNAAARPASQIPAVPIEEFEDETLLTETDTKVLGYLRTIRSVVPYMKATGWGRIVNIAGLNARTATSIAGSVRNVAVAALTKNLADELGPWGITATVVHPGFILTETATRDLERRAQASASDASDILRQITDGTSLRRLPSAAEVADVVTFLCSSRSGPITGDAIAVGGGQRGPIYY